MRRVLALLVAALAGPVGAPVRAQTLVDPDLAIQTVVTGLSRPTNMAFLGPDDFLILEKNAGAVRRVQNGVLSPTPVLLVPVNAQGERGLLGIAINTESPPGVFLYYTEAATLGGTAIANRVYRYDWNAGSAVLENPTLVLDLPVETTLTHNAGIVVLGPPGEVPGVGDGAVLYVVIGDQNRDGQLENFPAGPPPDDTAVIFRVQQDGSPVPGNPFTPYCSVTTTTTCSGDLDCPGGESCVLEVASYYAYGVRNSFGLGLDPVTGDLWDTENGPGSYDEINRVVPGMNSGWQQIMGPDSRDPQGPGDLFDIPGAGSTYDDPEFSWLSTIAPTAIVFPWQSALGAAYDDVAIVGDNNLSQLYALPLNLARDGFELSGIPLLANLDLVADSAAERDALLFAGGFNVVTDLELGPDGNLYVVSYFGGSVHRIAVDVPVIPALPGWSLGLLVVLVPALALAGRHLRGRVAATA